MEAPRRASRHRGFKTFSMRISLHTTLTLRVSPHLCARIRLARPLVNTCLTETVCCGPGLRASGIRQPVKRVSSSASFLIAARARPSWMDATSGSTTTATTIAGSVTLRVCGGAPTTRQVRNSTFGRSPDTSSTAARRNAPTTPALWGRFISTRMVPFGNMTARAGSTMPKMVLSAMSSTSTCYQDAIKTNRPSQQISL